MTIPKPLFRADSVVDGLGFESHAREKLNTVTYYNIKGVCDYLLIANNIQHPRKTSDNGELSPISNVISNCC